MVTKLEAITNFMDGQKIKNQLCPYNRDMEVQVQVKQGEGERVNKSFKGKNFHEFTDGVNTWKSFRIPWNANSTPEFTDTEQVWPLSKYAAGIGCTGWNWRLKRSEWFGFDFDSMVDHKAGLSQSDMEDVLERAKSIPWVSIIKSTRGMGYHFIVQVYPYITTENHTEHAVYARLILNYMSALTRFNFATKVDCLGGILWLWHEKADNVINSKLSTGKYSTVDNLYEQEMNLPYKILKKGVNLTKVPGSFDDNLKIVKGKSARPRDSNTNFNQLTSTNKHESLTKEHLELFKWLDQEGKLWWWDSDNNMVVCHTYDLKKAHTECNFKGIYETCSTGKESGNDQNCFGFPLAHGAWVFRRHGPGVKEHRYWEVDGSGWTKCYYNKKPSFFTVMRYYGGVKGVKDYEFSNIVDAEQCLASLGQVCSFPDKFKGRRVWIEPNKGKYIFVRVERIAKEDKDLVSFPGWRQENKCWLKPLLYVNEEQEIETPDELVRQVVLERAHDGWYIRTERGHWNKQPKSHVEVALKAEGKTKGEIELTLGKCIKKPWLIVYEPFQPEYLGDRRWNKDVPQLAFEPVKHHSGTPTWDAIIQHIGNDLTQDVKRNKWCVENNVVSGADYIRLWISGLLQYPKRPLPYLFLYSREEETGKSTLHEAISRLFKNRIGYVRADNALTNTSGFNGEISKSVLAVLEEVNLSESKAARERLKDMVTSERITIHKKGKQPYMSDNTTHWIHCANDERFIPMRGKDTRVTMIHVSKITKQIPRETLHKLIEEEAPGFLHDILNIEIPENDGRLVIPVIDSIAKINLGNEGNKTYVEMFIEENCHKVNGELIKYSDFATKFKKWLPAEENNKWSNQRISREIPTAIPKGKYGNDRAIWLGNVTWFKDRSPSKKISVSHSGNLVK